MAMDLKSMAVAMPEVAGHPNRAAFRGVLTVVDMPSQRPPSGSKGRLVVLTKRAAEAALPSLLGMAVDYSPSLDRHDVRCKVGVITSAEIVGRNVELGGYLFARNFPEIVEEIAKSESSIEGRHFGASRDKIHSSCALGAATATNPRPMRGCESAILGSSLRKAAAQIRRLSDALRGKRDLAQFHAVGSAIRAESCTIGASKGLGMSYEVTQVQVADTRAAVWVLEKVTFTGAAILRRDKAAYRDTWIELTT